MITLLCYLGLKYFLADDWSWFGLILPVLLDCAIINFVENLGK